MSDDDAERAHLEAALAGTAKPALGFHATMGRLAELYLLQPDVPGNLPRALTLARTAADAVGADDPLLPKLRHLQAMALRRIDPTDAGGTAAHIERDAWRRSLEIAPREAIGFAAEWGDWAWRQQRWDEAAEAYADAGRALRRFLLRQVGDSRAALEQFPYARFASRAAFAFAKLDKGRDALIQLERVNDLSFGHHAQRSDILALRQSHPDLATRLDAAIAASVALVAPARQNFGLDSFGNLSAAARTAQATLDAVVGEVRALDGFALFALPSNWNDIAQAASAAPLVYLIATDQGSAAFVLHQPTGAPPRMLAAMFGHTEQDILLAAKPFIDIEFGDVPGDRRAALFALLEWLGLHVMYPVRTALEQLGRADQPVVIVPFGLLATLPLHAAAVMLQDPPRLHYFLHPRDVTFAYWARRLVAARQRQAGRIGGPSLTINNPKPLPAIYDPLLLSDDEAGAVVRHLPGTVLSGHAATTQNVMAALPHADLVHFSCHGSVDRRIGYSAILLLANSEILSFEHLRRMAGLTARLVVLSACRTAAAALEVEQIVSLPAAFLAAGAASVLGTFWHTEEVASVLLLGRFYDLLFAGGLPPAAALGEAQAWLMMATAATLRAALPADALESSATDGLRAAADDDRPYMHPWFWAPFFIAGA